MSFLTTLFLVIMAAILIFYLLLLISFLSLIFHPQATLSPFLLKRDRYPKNAHGHIPSVSVLIPARNEEHNIGNCLSALLEQDFPNFEVIVIDDQSTDRTAEVVRKFQEKSKAVKLIKGKELPPGWIGKNHALYQGVQKASGEYLLFLDADAKITSSRCINQTVNYALEHNSDLLTLVPQLECKSFWEKVVMPLFGFIVINGFILKKINDPDSKITSVVGPYLFFKRTTYEKLGGHEKIKGEIVEDLVLARTVKKEGFRLSYLLGTELFSLREYNNLRGIWEGFSKNFFVGMEEKIGLAILCIFLIFTVLVLPWLLVPIALSYLIFFGVNNLIIMILILALIPCFITIAIRRLLSILGGLDDTYAFLQPLGALVFIGILINSTIKVSFGKGVTWKGRTYLDG